MDQSEYQLLERYRETIRTLTSKTHVLESKNKDLEIALVRERQTSIAVSRENSALKDELKKTRALVTWLPSDYSAMDV